MTMSPPRNPEPGRRKVYLVWEDGGSILVALLNLAIPALQIFLTYTLCLGRQQEHQIILIRMVRLVRGHTRTRVVAHPKTPRP